MVSPLPLVGDVHTLFALSARFGHRAVAVDDGQVEKVLRLFAPDPDANLVDGLHENFDVFHLETPTEVAGRGGVRDSLGSEGVGKDFVVAAQFDMFQALSAAEEIVGDVEHVIGFVVGPVNLQQVQPPVDGVDQPALPREGVYRSDSSAGQPASLVRQVILDVACREHGVRLILPFDVPETVMIFPLATG
jgi:hypothetical protein